MPLRAGFPVELLDRSVVLALAGLDIPGLLSVSDTGTDGEPPAVVDSAASLLVTEDGRRAR